MAQTVIIKAISGQREWDPAKGPLKPWLMDQVKSEVDALARSASHRHEVVAALDDAEEEAAPPERHTVRPIEPRAEPEEPEAALLRAEHERQVSERISAFFRAVEGDPDLEEIVTAIMGDCGQQPRFLAEALGIDVSEVNNRLKRLRRLIRTPKEDPA